MTTPENITVPTVPRSSPIEHDLARAIASAANLPAGRWAVKVNAEHDDRLDETLVTAIASVRVHATITDESVSQADYTSVIQGVAARVGRELRSVIDAHDIDLETLRRLHEAATERAATLRTALEGVIRAHEEHNTATYADWQHRHDAIAKAREVLA